MAAAPQPTPTPEPTPSQSHYYPDGRGKANDYQPPAPMQSSWPQLSAAGELNVHRDTLRQVAKAMDADIQDVQVTLSDLYQNGLVSEAQLGSPDESRVRNRQRICGYHAVGQRSDSGPHSGGRPDQPVRECVQRRREQQHGGRSGRRPRLRRQRVSTAGRVRGSGPPLARRRHRRHQRLWRRTRLTRRVQSSALRRAHFSGQARNWPSKRSACSAMPSG